MKNGLYDILLNKNIFKILFKTFLLGITGKFYFNKFCIFLKFFVLKIL